MDVTISNERYISPISHANDLSILYLWASFKCYQITSKLVNQAIRI